VDLPATAPTIFYPPRWRLLALAATTALFGAASLVAARADLTFWRFAGSVLAAGFGLATGVLLVRALRPGPTVVIDADGIIDRTSLAPTGLVRWPEVAAVRKREIGRGMGRERLLEIVLVHPDRFRARPRGWARRLADRYRALIKQPDVTIPGSMVAKPMATLIAELQRWRPELEVLELPPPHPRLLSRLGRSRLHPPPKQHPDLPRW
jgi:hypothetical protein